MNIENDKIPHPYKAPDGYFANFENRLSEKLGHEITTVNDENLSVEKRRKSLFFSAAASVVFIAFGAIMLVVYNKSNTNTVAKVESKSEEKIETNNQQKEIEKLAETQPEVLQSKVIEEIITEIPEKPIKAVKHSKRDMATAQELEDAGLIVNEVDNPLFEESEI